MSRKKISTTIYITPGQSERLKMLHERTKVPVAVYIREGIDMVLSALAAALKAVERDKYIASIVAQNVAPLDWERQCQLVSTYIQQNERFLPPQLRDTDAAQWAGHLADLIVSHMSSQRRIERIIGIDR